MDWNETREQRRKMIEEVMKPLNEAEKHILVWLLQQERKHRDSQRTHIVKNLHERIETMLPPGDSSDS